MWLSQDPMAESYYPMTPYLYCAGSPGNLVDPSGKYVVALGNEAILAIMSILSDEELAFISFDDNGLLDNSLLQKYLGNSILMNTLSALSGDKTTGYYLSISDSANGVSFFDTHTDTNNPNNYYYGVTQMPGSKINPSPDSNVHVISASFLDPRRRAKNVAHELLGHAYFYYLRKSDPSINPNHTFVKTGEEEYYDEEFGMFLTRSIYTKNNKRLEDYIEQVEAAALKNFDKKNK